MNIGLGAILARIYLGVGCPRAAAAAWLSDAPDDLPGIARALGDIARAKGMTEVARVAGLSRESLYPLRKQ